MRKGEIYLKILTIYFIILLLIYSVFLMFFSYKSGKMLKTLLLSAFLGLAVLTLVNAFSVYTGVDISVNGWTVGSSAVFGVPAVFGLLLLRIFF